MKQKMEKVCLCPHDLFQGDSDKHRVATLRDGTHVEVAIDPYIQEVVVVVETPKGQHYQSTMWTHFQHKRWERRRIMRAMVGELLAMSYRYTRRFRVEVR